MRLVIWILLVFVLTASACGAVPGVVAPTPVPATPTGAANPLANTQWQLVSFGPAGAESPVLAGTTITLAFESVASDGQAGGSGGCNQYGSTYQIQGDTLSFGEITQTLRACQDADLMQQEERYLAALAAAGRFEVTGDRLTIWYDDGQDVLTFVKATATPPPGMLSN